MWSSVTTSIPPMGVAPVVASNSGEALKRCGHAEEDRKNRLKENMPTNTKKERSI